MIRIKAVGDLMPGGILNKKNIQFLSSDVADYLKSADIRIGTLECGIGNEPTFCPIKRSKGSSAFVYAEDKDLERLAKININFSNDEKLKFIVKNVISSINNINFYNLTINNDEIHFLVEESKKIEILSFLSKKLNLIKK